MRKLIALDTSVAIDMISPHPIRGQEQRWHDARALAARSDEFEFAISTPAVGEVIAFLPSVRQVQVGEDLESLFRRILVYDFQAALLVGRWHNRSLEKRKQRPLADQGGRQCLKVDLEILACAVRYKAHGICFVDGDHADLVTEFALPIEAGPPMQFLKSVQLSLPQPKRQIRRSE